MQLCLLIDGAIPLPQLFDVLNSKVDPLILSKLASVLSSNTVSPRGWRRPFVETTTSQSSMIGQSRTKIVEFMEEDESVGEVCILWLGPPPSDHVTTAALQILGSYLTHSAASPLQKEFIEIPKPYATSISFESEDRVNKSEVRCSISDVPMKHLEAIGEMIKRRIEEIAENEGINMERMGLVLRREKRKLLSSTETNVSSVLADRVISGKSPPIARAAWIDSV